MNVYVAETSLGWRLAAQAQEMTAVHIAVGDSVREKLSEDGTNSLAAGVQERTTGYVVVGEGSNVRSRWPSYAEGSSQLLGFLFSYHYCRKVDMDELIAPLDPRPPLFADSGAFSAHTLGSEISVGEYAEWLTRWGHLFDHHANLDVLTDAKASARNQRALERKGLDPLPVFHGGEPWRVLERMVEKYDYVALGGIARFKNKPVLVGWLDRCFSIAEGKAALHGFGMTRWELVRRFPWRSVDSSAIGSGYRYGTVKTYNPYDGKWISWRVADTPAWGKYGWLVREYGLTPADFPADDRPQTTRSLIRLATRSMRRAINDLPATQLYLAEAKGKQAGVERVHEYGKANGKAAVFAATTYDGYRSHALFNEANGEAAGAPQERDDNGALPAVAEGPARSRKRRAARPGGAPPAALPAQSKKKARRA